ncbi:uncharacterized protein LOC144283431 isoform X2 [Canis aureus]
MGPGSWGYSLGPLASMPPEPVPAATDHPHVPCAPHRPASLGRPMHAEKLNLATGKARVAEARPDGRRSARGHPRLRLRAVAPVTRSRGRGFLLGAEARACHPDRCSARETLAPFAAPGSTVSLRSLNLVTRSLVEVKPGMCVLLSLGVMPSVEVLGPWLALAAVTRCADLTRDPVRTLASLPEGAVGVQLLG